MQASAWKKYGKSETDTNCCFGLYVGTPNRREFFEGLKTAEVEIDGRVCVFSLQRSNFWTTCPEIRDEDTDGGTPIRDWLERYRSLTWTKRMPPKAELVLLGPGRFRLEA